MSEEVAAAPVDGEDPENSKLINQFKLENL
jgi:hypothetical protein